MVWQMLAHVYHQQSACAETNRYMTSKVAEPNVLRQMQYISNQIHPATLGIIWLATVERLIKSQEFLRKTYVAVFNLTGRWWEAKNARICLIWTVDSTTDSWRCWILSPCGFIRTMNIMSGGNALMRISDSLEDDVCVQRIRSLLNRNGGGEEHGDCMIYAKKRSDAL